MTFLGKGLDKNCGPLLTPKAPDQNVGIEKIVSHGGPGQTFWRIGAGPFSGSD